MMQNHDSVATVMRIRQTESSGSSGARYHAAAAAPKPMPCSSNELTRRTAQLSTRGLRRVNRRPRPKQSMFPAKGTERSCRASAG